MLDRRVASGPAAAPRGRAAVGQQQHLERGLFAGTAQGLQQRLRQHLQPIGVHFDGEHALAPIEQAHRPRRVVRREGRRARRGQPSAPPLPSPPSAAAAPACPAAGARRPASAASGRAGPRGAASTSSLTRLSRHDRLRRLGYAACTPRCSQDGAPRGSRAAWSASPARPPRRARLPQRGPAICADNTRRTSMSDAPHASRRSQTATCSGTGSDARALQRQRRRPRDQRPSAAPRAAAAAACFA